MTDDPTGGTPSGDDRGWWSRPGGAGTTGWHAAGGRAAPAERLDPDRPDAGRPGGAAVGATELASPGAGHDPWARPAPGRPHPGAAPDAAGGTAEWGTAAYGTAAYGTAAYGAAHGPTPYGRPAGGGYDATYGGDGGGGSNARRGVLGAGAVAALLVLVSLLAVAGGGAAGYLAAGYLADQRAERLLDPDPGLGSTPRGSTVRPPDSVAGVAEAVLPSVVSIAVRSPEGNGTGSGFVLREDGYLLTNNHVVDSAATTGTIQVRFSDGGSAEARLVGTAPEADLAVLKIEAAGLEPARLGDSDAVVVGDPVIAVGSPLGLVGTVTSGIVSAKDRPVTAGRSDDQAFINAIQTDAAINPGNSGGPLVNGTGEVIGVNSAIATIPSAGAAGAPGNIGLGFAIPMNQARRVAEQLISTGTATYAVIGATLDRTYAGEGARVVPSASGGQAPLLPDGPAERAGLRPGDVITAIDGRPVTDGDDLIVAIRSRAPGEDVELTVRRGIREQEIPVTLGESGG